MVTRADGNSEILRTEPCETPPRVATETMDPESSASWNAWWDQRFEPQRLALCDGIADAMHEEIGTLERKMCELELKLAAATGAIDVLRGRNLPGSFNVKGTFDSETVYNYLDVVAHGGSSWIATRDRPGELPGDGWQLLASAGRRGERGARGPEGERGPEGPRWRSVSFDAGKNAFLVRLSDGSPGPVISLDCVFAGVDVDPVDYAIVLKTIDGTELRFSVKPLFERFFHEVTGR
jgi:hypothetical protein